MAFKTLSVALHLPRPIDRTTRRILSQHTNNKHNMSHQPVISPTDDPEPNMAGPDNPPLNLASPQHGLPVAHQHWPLQRSFSTPDARQIPLQSPEDLQSGLSEKKRNKLGYHRIPVACSESVPCHTLRW